MDTGRLYTGLWHCDCVPVPRDHRPSFVWQDLVLISLQNKYVDNTTSNIMVRRLKLQLVLVIRKVWNGLGRIFFYLIFVFWYRWLFTIFKTREFTGPLPLSLKLLQWGFRGPFLWVSEGGLQPCIWWPPHSREVCFLKHIAIFAVLHIRVFYPCPLQ